MSCPTCTHTMHRISDLLLVFHCPRCGTVQIKAPMTKGYNTHTPQLIERAHKLAVAVDETEHTKRLADLGVEVPPTIEQGVASVLESTTGQPYR